ncbi:hypothetical protein BDR06DRAFT_482457 [Suillus hirtellus]|nr:hypothetical protein BDR06DRAFT_482457 [Suillus hirtellus]
MRPLTEARAERGRKENLADPLTPSKPSSHEMLIDRRAADDMVILLEFRTNLMLVQRHIPVVVVKSHECQRLGLQPALQVERQHKEIRPHYAASATNTFPSHLALWCVSLRNGEKSNRY